MWSTKLVYFFPNWKIFSSEDLPLQEQNASFCWHFTSVLTSQPQQTASLCHLSTQQSKLPRLITDTSSPQTALKNGHTVGKISAVWIINGSHSLPTLQRWQFCHSHSVDGRQLSKIGLKVQFGYLSRPGPRIRGEWGQLPRMDNQVSLDYWMPLSSDPINVLMCCGHSLPTHWHKCQERPKQMLLHTTQHMEYVLAWCDDGYEFGWLLKKD